MSLLRSYLALLVLSLMGGTYALAQVAALSFSEAQQLAIEAQKPFMLICGKDDCPFTRKTLDEVLQYQPLLYYLQDNFIAGYLDISAPENLQEAKNFSLTVSTPTFLIFQPSGKLEHRYDVFMDQEQLYDSLIVVAEGGAHPERLFFDTRSAVSPAARADDSEFEREAAPMPENYRMPVNSRTMFSTAWEKDIVVSEPQLPAVQHRNLENLMLGLEQFGLQLVDTLRPYGLLYGRFTDRASVDTAVEYLAGVWLNKDDIRKNDVWVFLTPNMSVPEFNVVLGSFSSEEEANSFAQPLRSLLQAKQPAVIDLLNIQP